MIILALLAVAAQALLGGLRGPGALCLGGGHTHEHADADARPCESACRHEGGLPDPLEDRDHDEHCGCTDLTLAIDDPYLVPRGGSEQAALVPAIPAVCQGVIQPTGSHPRSWWARADDGGGGHALTIVRSTRLLI